MTASEARFVEGFEKDVKKTIDSYGLATAKDKVLVACSGGKDSTVTLYLLKKFGFNVEAIFVDLLIANYSEKNLANVKNFCEQLGVKLHIVDYRQEIGCSNCYITAAVRQHEKVKNCHVCGILKKYMLNKKARELKATKLATGHNLDDEAQTFLMNLLRGNVFLSASSGPITVDVADKKFIPRIKPLYFAKESASRKYSKLMGFPVIYERCPCGFEAFRGVMRDLLNEEEKKIPKLKENLVQLMLKAQSKLRQKTVQGSLSYCEKCGEPSRNQTCSACRLLAKAKLTA